MDFVSGAYVTRRRSTFPFLTVQFCFIRVIDIVERIMKSTSRSSSPRSGSSVDVDSALRSNGHDPKLFSDRRRAAGRSTLSSSGNSSGAENTAPLGGLKVDWLEEEV